MRAARAGVALCALTVLGALLLLLREPEPRRAGATGSTAASGPIRPQAGVPAEGKGVGTGAGDSGAEASAGEATSAGEQAPTIRGRVLLDGRPLPGAEVQCWDGGLLQRTATDAEGRFRFEGGRASTLVAVHPGRAPARAGVTGVEQDVVLEFGEALSLEVLVVDGVTGRPVAGATVAVARAGDPRTGVYVDDRLAEVRGVRFVHAGGAVVPPPPRRSAGEPSIPLPRGVTDGAGLVRLVGLPPGAVDLAVEHDAYPPAREESIPVSTRLARVELPPPGRLVVAVPAPLPENPPQVVVNRYGEYETLHASRRLDEEGRAEFEGLAPGEYRVVLADARPSLQAVVAVHAGRTTTLDFRESARPAVPLRCRVLVDEALGTRVPLVVLLGGEGFRDQIEVEPGADSTFLVEARRDYRLVAQCGGFANRALDVTVRDAPAEVEIPLRGATLQGTVRGPRGTRWGDARVVVEPVAARWTDAQSNLADVFASVAAATITRGDGTYEVRGLAPGAYRVYCGNERSLEVKRVEIVADERAVLDFEPDGPGAASLAVQLRDEAGAPVAGRATVVREDGGPGPMRALRAIEGSGGTFRLPPGEYRVFASAPGYASERGHPVVVRGDASATIVLARERRARLRFAEGLRDFDVVDAAGLSVRLRPMADGPIPRNFRTDVLGRATVSGLGPGRFTVRSGGRTLGEFRIEAADVEVDLR